jgi:hypothetical protein
MSRIIRVIMFKIPSLENQLEMAKLYKTLSTAAVKVSLSDPSHTILIPSHRISQILTINKIIYSC